MKQNVKNERIIYDIILSYHFFFLRYCSNLWIKYIINKYVNAFMKNSNV